MNNTIRTVALVGMLAAASACTPFATYPPADNKAINPQAAVNDPIPALMVGSIEYSQTIYATSGDPAINLPAGSSRNLYKRVIHRLGTGHPMTDPKELAYQITQVRARGTKAQVDIFVPRADGTYGFATLYFGHTLKGYRVEHIRWWETGDQPPGIDTGTPAQQPPAAAQPVLAHQ